MLGYYKEPSRRAMLFTADGWLRTRRQGRARRRRAGCASADGSRTSSRPQGQVRGPAPIEDKLVMHTAVEAAASPAPTSAAARLVNAEHGAAQRALDGKEGPRWTSLAGTSSRSTRCSTRTNARCLVVVTQPWTESGLITPYVQGAAQPHRGRLRRHYERWVAGRRTVVWARGPEKKRPGRKPRALIGLKAGLGSVAEFQRPPRTCSSRRDVVTGVRANMSVMYQRPTRRSRTRRRNPTGSRTSRCPRLELLGEARAHADAEA